VIAKGEGGYTPTEIDTVERRVIEGILDGRNLTWCWTPVSPFVGLICFTVTPAVPSFRTPTPIESLLV
jgi:hypothetical protein